VRNLIGDVEDDGGREGGREGGVLRRRLLLLLLGGAGGLDEEGSGRRELDEGLREREKEGGRKEGMYVSIKN